MEKRREEVFREEEEEKEGKRKRKGKGGIKGGKRENL
jgi:hypothetical protein